jgi:hypothetical protein
MDLIVTLKTLSIMTLGISIKLHYVCLAFTYCYAECHYAKCRGSPLEEAHSSCSLQQDKDVTMGS